MARDVQNLRDLLSLARLLRRFAEQHNYDANRELFLATAAALEARTHFLATAPAGETAALERAIAPHAPINQLV